MNDIISQRLPVTVAPEHSLRCSGDPHERWCDLAPCPDWCRAHPVAGKAAGEATGQGDPGGWHKTADCPPWCGGHRSWLPEPGPGEAHTSAETVVCVGTGQTAPGTWMDVLDTASLSVSVWLEDSGPAVVTMRTANDMWLPDMTPAAARQLAQALLAAADMADGAPVSGPLDLTRQMAVLDAAMAMWATRDDSKAQPEVRQAANTAMDAIGAMLRELHTAREALVGEIRQSDDANAARVDAMLAEMRRDGAR